MSDVFPPVSGRLGHRPPLLLFAPAAVNRTHARRVDHAEFSPLLYSAERGDLANEFVPISEEEASRIVARIREQANPGE
jgi:hypothetical protein